VLDLTELNEAAAAQVKAIAAKIEGLRDRHPKKIVTPFIVAQVLGQPLTDEEIAADIWAHGLSSAGGVAWADLDTSLRMELLARVHDVRAAIHRLNSARYPVSRSGFVLMPVLLAIAFVVYALAAWAW
jgi:hypothetical protein